MQFKKYAISELPSASVSKEVQVQNLSYENEFDLHSNGLVSNTDFHKKGFALQEHNEVCFYSSLIPLLSPNW